MSQLPLGKYQHFKGMIVEVIGLAKHSETLEEMVVYRHDNQLRTRPLKMFLEEVTRDGKTFPRFKYVGE